MKIFAIDDEPDVLETLHEAIAAAVPEAEILDFRRGLAALEAVKEQGIIPDVVFSDIRMPDMNGLDATRIIKEVNHEIPIVALSAYAFDENIREAKAAGCDEFLAKPFRVEDLLDTVGKYVESID